MSFRWKRQGTNNHYVNFFISSYLVTHAFFINVVPQICRIVINCRALFRFNVNEVLGIAAVCTHRIVTSTALATERFKFAECIFKSRAFCSRSANNSIQCSLAAFAHTAVPLKVSTPEGFDERAYAAQFTLPDGSLPIICDKSGNGGTHHPSTMPCEFCSLADNAALYAPLWEKTNGDCEHGLENPATEKTLVFTKTLLGLHGASRAPPRI